MKFNSTIQAIIYIIQTVISNKVSPFAFNTLTLSSSFLFSRIITVAPSILKLNTEEEEETSNASFEIPGYAYNQTTHNVTGLLESLERHKVTDLKEKQAIMKLSDYGRKGTQIWRLFSNTTWGKIGAPGKYIIAALTNKQK